MPPGDVLAIETLDVLDPDLVHSPINGFGSMTSADHRPVTWQSIETLIQPDRFELNETIETATVLGSLPKITLRDLSIHRMANFAEPPMVDVFLLFDDTGSFASAGPVVREAFPDIIDALEAQLSGASLAFGVGRFEEYGNFAGEFDTGRPFILNQPIVDATATDFMIAIDAALNRTAPGSGGDLPNSRLDTLQAAVLNVKLQHLRRWAIGRQRNATRYRDEFARLGLDKQLGIPQVAAGCDSVWNQYTIRIPDGRRDELQQFLAARKIGSAIYYPVPLHLQECFAELGYQSGSLPATEQAAAEVLSLPIYAELTMSGQDRTIRAIAEFLGIEYAADDAQRAA